MIKEIALCCTVAAVLTLKPPTGAPEDAPEDLIEMTEDIGGEYGICPELLQAMAFYESSFDADAKNGSCVGLLQVNPKWHKDRMKRLEVTDIMEPTCNIMVAADYLAELFDEYEDVGYVLDVYNGNSKAEYNAEHGILSKYSRKILKYSEYLERKHGK